MIQDSRVPNPSSDEGKAALGQADITPQMNDAQRLITLDRYFKANKVQDVRGWLRKNKIGSDATREGFEARLKMAEELDQRLKANTATPAGKQTIEDNEKFRATDRAAGAARAKTVEKVVDQVEGEQVEPLERAKKFAESRRRIGDPHHYNTLDSLSRKYAGGLWGRMTSGVDGEAYFNETDERFGAIPNLKSEGAKYGVDVSKQFPDIELGNLQARSRAFKEAAESIQAKSLGKAGVYGERKAEAKSRARVKQMRPADAAAPGQKVASIDADKFDRAVGQLASVSQALGVAARNLSNERPLPGADLGGSYAPHRA